jgi:hypothetical protein
LPVDCAPLNLIAYRRHRLINKCRLTFDAEFKVPPLPVIRTPTAS